MDGRQVRELLEKVRGGETSIEQAIEALRVLPFDDLGFANVDHHRALRQGVPEVILGQSKTAAQIAGVARSLVTAGSAVYVTRLGSEKVPELLQQVPELVYDAASSTASYLPNPP